MPARQGIVCFEGSWSDSLDSRESIEPALRCIESMGAAAVVHKDVGTREELKYYIDKWLGPSGRKMPSYRMGMFAFHGSRNNLLLGADEITLDELADMIGRRAHGRVIYLGSCEALALADGVLTDFCRRTNARGLVGYTKAVPLLETAAFEILLVMATLQAGSFKPIYAKLRREHREWTEKLGLRMAHRTWASPRWMAN